MKKAERPPDWRPGGRNDVGAWIGTYRIPRSPIRLQDIDWRGLAEKSAHVSGCLGDTSFIEDIAFFAENPDAREQCRNVLHKEWPRCLSPSKAFTDRVRVRRWGNTFEFAYFRPKRHESPYFHRRRYYPSKQRPWITVFVPLWQLAERARRLGRA